VIGDVQVYKDLHITKKYSTVYFNFHI